MSNDLNNSLSEIMNSSFINYKGCLIEVRFAGTLFIWNKCHCHTLVDIRRHIDLSLESLAASIAECKEREDWLENKLERLEYKNDKP